MATTPMHRVRAQISGVAGSPYWLTGYFDHTAVGANDAAVEWIKFIATNSVGLPTGWTLTAGGEVQLVDPVSGDVIDVEPIAQATLSGSTNANLAPKATQILCRWRTEAYVAGRRVQGHTNIPMVYTSDINTGGGVAGATQTAWQAKITGLLTGAAGDAFCIWSRAAGAHFPVASGSVWNQFSVLRSRRD